MEISSSFKIIYSMIKKSLKINLRYKVDSISILLRPIIAILPLILYVIYSKNEDTIFFYNTGTHQYLNYLILSFFFISFVSNIMISASMLITSEMQQGTFEIVLLTSDNSLILWCGEIISNIIIQLINSVLFYSIIMIIFKQKIYINNPRIFIFSIIITGIISIGLGVLLAGITIKTKLPKMSFMISSIILFLAGSTYPVTVFPKWLTYIAFLNPVTFCIDLTRYSILGTKTYLNLNNEIIIVIIYSILFLSIGILIYNDIIVKLKKQGTLSNY